VWIDRLHSLSLKISTDPIRKHVKRSEEGHYSHEEVYVADISIVIGKRKNGEMRGKGGGRERMWV
jgi:hypothetical protein